MAKRKPIILIPGIQGTKLFDTNQKDFKTVWSGVKKFFSDIHQLALKDNGVSDKYLDAVIERADIEDLAYSELINYLKSQGYRVYIFGYDWRRSNRESAIALGHFVERIKRRFGNINSFNFITHSMGGLVFSAYLKSLDAAQREEVVERAVMTVPPFLGSMESVLSLTMGSSMLFNSSDDFRKVARTFPAIYELLPVYPQAYCFDSQRTQQDYSPYRFDSYWQHVAAAERSDTLATQKLIKRRLRDLGKIRDQNDYIFDFSQQPASLRSKLVIISGAGSQTRQQSHIREGYKHYKYFFEFEQKPESLLGDGTVPSISSNCFADSVTTIEVHKSGFEAWMDSRFLGADHHAFFLNNGRVQNVITRFLKEKTGSEFWFESADNSVVKV